MTIDQLRKILRDNGVEYFVQKQGGCIATIHVIVKEKENATDS